MGWGSYLRAWIVVRCGGRIVIIIEDLAEWGSSSAVFWLASQHPTPVGTGFPSLASTSVCLPGALVVVIWVTKYSNNLPAGEHPEQWDMSIHLTEALLLYTYAFHESHVSFTSFRRTDEGLVTRGSRVDDDTGTTFPHLNRKFLRVFQREEGERPPIHTFLRDADTLKPRGDLGRPRPQLRAITWRFADFSSLSLCSLSPRLEMSDSPPP